jgi:hypothetical protein
MFSSLAKSAMTVGAAAGCLLMTTGSASAFSFTTNFVGTPPTGNIFLESITTQNGTTISNFALVSEVPDVTFTNDLYSGGNTGAASTDHGDTASGTAIEDPNGAQVQEILGNLNLNNIVDTEDNGSFSMTLKFDKAFNTLLLWERGQNSKIGVKVGDTDLGIFNSADFAYAGYKIDTTEIKGQQEVGSRGIKLSDYGIGSVNEITLYADQSLTNFRGPDFKVVGATVPEPATVLGLTAVAGAFVASRRRKGERTA